MIDLLRALAVLAEPPCPETAWAARALGIDSPLDAADHDDLFLFQLYPYASVYMGAEGMLGGEARDRVAGFWRALHLEPPPEPDHLAALLGLHASILEAEAAEADPARRLLRRQARTALLHEHLLPWLPPYLVKVGEVAGPGHRRWAQIALEVLAAEALAAGPAATLPRHLAVAPPLPDPRSEGAEAFLQGLLAPVRSGLILVRADLQRAARELGLGLRAGERRYSLAALLGQDPGPTLGWLAAEAEAWRERHARWAASGPPSRASGRRGRVAPRRCCPNWRSRPARSAGSVDGPAQPWPPCMLPACTSPMRLPSGSLNWAMRGPPGTSAGGISVWPPAPSIDCSVCSRLATST